MHEVLISRVHLLKVLQSNYTLLTYSPWNKAITVIRSDYNLAYQSTDASNMWQDFCYLFLSDVDLVKILFCQMSSDVKLCNSELNTHNKYMKSLKRLYGT